MRFSSFKAVKPLLPFKILTRQILGYIIFERFSLNLILKIAIIARVPLRQFFGTSIGLFLSIRFARLLLPPLVCRQYYYYPSRPFIKPIPRSEAIDVAVNTLPSPSPPPYNLGENDKFQKQGFYTKALFKLVIKYVTDTIIIRIYYERIANMIYTAAITTRTSLFLFVLGDVVTMQTLQLLQTTISGLALGLRALHTCIQAPIHPQIDHHSYFYHSSPISVTVIFIIILLIKIGSNI